MITLCIFACLHQSVTTGLIPACLSTLEQRYGLTSFDSGLILSTYDFVKLLMVIPISYLGGKGHIPRAMACCCVVLSVGCAIFVSVHFLSPVYTPQTSTAFEAMCSLIPNLPVCLPRNASSLFSVLLVGQAVIAIGAAAVYCIGPAYIISNLQPKQALVAVGLFYACGAIGPAIGFLEGGFFLNSWVDMVGLPAGFEQLTPTSANWAGRWWIGILLAGCGILLLAPFFLLMPETTVRVFGQSDPSLSLSLSDPILPTISLKDAWRMIRTILINPGWWFLTLAVASEAFVVAGFSGFGAKYLQVQFGLESGTASLVAGGGIVPAAAIGMFTGGWWDGKKHSKLSQTAAFNTKMALLSTLFLVVTLFFGCEPRIEGVSSQPPYLSLNENCNHDCNCGQYFTPICGENGITYFSPCYAGCQNVSASGSSYMACQCINLNLPSVSRTAVSGRCSQCTTMLVLFMAAFFLFLLCTMLNHSPSTAALMRIFPQTHQSLSLALNDFFYKCLGAIPGPLLFGASFDGSCIVSASVCPDDSGNCVLYDNVKLRFLLLLLFGVGFKILSSFFNACSYLAFKRAEAHADLLSQLLPDYEDDNEIDQPDIGLTESTYGSLIGH